LVIEDLEIVDAMVKSSVETGDMKMPFKGLPIQFGCGDINALCASVGRGVVKVDEVRSALRGFGVNKAMGWGTLRIRGEENKVGLLARMAMMLTESGINIMREVNDVRESGYEMRAVYHLASQKQIERLKVMLESDEDFAGNYEIV
jgi:hypothetical protein